MSAHQFVSEAAILQSLEAGPLRLEVLWLVLGVDDPRFAARSMHRLVQAGKVGFGVCGHRYPDDQHNRSCIVEATGGPR